MSKRTPPERFINLHLHTSAGSIGDAIGSAADHFAFAHKNGMNASAVTDHGNMVSYSFAHMAAKSMKDKGVNFKHIPGIEAYFVPSLEKWSEHKKIADERNRLAKEAEKEAKANKTRKKAVEAIEDEFDVGDETRESIKEIQEIYGASDTENPESNTIIENEEESKTKNFRDPVKQRNHIVLLAKNDAGLKALFRLTSRGFTEGFYRYPRLDLKMLKEECKGNVVALSACCAGNLASIVFDNQIKTDHNLWLPNDDNFELIQKLLKDRIEEFKDAVGEENYYAEIQFNKLGFQHLANYHIIEAAKRTNTKLVATADAHYSDPSHWREREIYKAMAWASKNKGQIEKEKIPETIDGMKCELYPKNAEQMWSSYKQYCSDKFDFYNDDIVHEAIENSWIIAHEQIEAPTPDRKVKLPSITKLIPANHLEEEVEKLGPGADEDAIAFEDLKRLAKEGLVKRNKDTSKEYVARMVEELRVIKKLKFSRYFLTYAKIMNTTTDVMLTGFGRGCLVGDTKVYVAGSRSKALKDISIGDTVYDVNGNESKVINRFEYDVSESGLSIKSEHSFGRTTLTKDHKLYGHKVTVDSAYTGKRWQRKYKKFVEFKPEWRPANEFSVGDFLYTPFPKRINVITPAAIDLSLYAPTGAYVIHDKDIQNRNILTGSVGNTSFKRYLSFDEEFCYLLGRWIGDGWYTIDVRHRKYALGLAFNSSDTQSIDRFKRYFSSLGFSPKIRRSKTRRLVQLMVHNKPLASAMANLFPEYESTSATKYLGFLKALPDSLLRQVLLGLKHSDGYTDHSYQRESIDTTSERLAFEIKEALLALKIKSTVKIREPYERKQKGKTYSCKRSYKVTFTGLELPANTKNVIHSGYFSRILDVSPVPLTKVYDISVGGHPSYTTCNSIVHNSAAGSLLAYCLNITQVDPIVYNLLFERFLTDKKIDSYPDIDCVDSSHLIAMADGTFKPISDICVRDVILDLDSKPKHVLCVQTRSTTKQDIMLRFFVEDSGTYGTIIVTSKHRLFLNDRSIIEASCAVPGQTLHSKTGGAYILAIEPVDDCMTVTDITVEGSRSFQLIPHNTAIIDSNSGKFVVSIDNYSIDADDYRSIVEKECYEDFKGSGRAIKIQ